MSAVQLTDGQALAVEAIRAAGAGEYRGKGPLVVAGFAGTGKTTLLKAAEEEVALRCLTPTGKAALRVTEATGLPACTIHRWLYMPMVDPRTGRVTFRRREGDDLDLPASRVLVVDEASMVGPEVWADLSAAAETHGLTVVLVGDPFQLPPVQPRGAPTFSVFDQSFPAARRVLLRQVMRQALDSPIVAAATALRDGDLAPLRDLPRISREAIRNHGFKEGVDRVVLCHRNVTRQEINDAIRRARGFDYALRKGEPLLVLRNNYAAEVYNGEVLPFAGWSFAPTTILVNDRFNGTKEDLNIGATVLNGTAVTLCEEQVLAQAEPAFIPLEEAAGTVAEEHGLIVASQFDGEQRPIPHVHAALGYALTAHKAQGSEWNDVLIMYERSIDLKSTDGQRWFYTALTRAVRNVAVCWK